MKNKSENKNEVVRMELKYCECCGSLWLRVAGVQQVYCPECLPEIEQLPQPTNRVHRSRLPLGPQPGDVNEFDFDVDLDIDPDNDLDFDFGDFDAMGFNAGGMA
jgi:hypothetical protein